MRTRPEQVAQSASAGNPGLAESASTLPGLEVNEALRTRAFWMLAVFQFCYTFAFGGSFIHLVQYLIGIGYTQAAGTMVVSFSLGLAVIGKPAMGMLGDRIGGKNALALCLFIGAVNTTLLRSRAIRRRHRLLHRVIRGLRAGRTGGRRCFISLRGACAGIGGMVRAK